MSSVVSEKEQRLYISALISDRDVFTRTISALEPKYFVSPLDSVIKFLKEFYSKYSDIPSPSIVETYTSEKFLVARLTTKQRLFVIERINNFIKHSAIKHALIESVDLLEENRFVEIEQNIKQAVESGIDYNIGIVYSDSVDERILAPKESTSRCWSSGYTLFDKHIGGGIKTKEIYLVMANTGGGKSLFLANLARNLFFQDVNVLYVSFELFQDSIDQRLHCMIGDVSQLDLRLNPRAAAEKIKEKVKAVNGNLVIKYLPTRTTPLEIKSYIQTVETKMGVIPDVIILDHIDLIKPDERVPESDVFTKDKLVIEAVRNIAVEYDVAILTASQQNRSAVSAERVDRSHIAGGYSKIHASDYVCSLLFDPITRELNEGALQMIKTRNTGGEGRYVKLKWDPETLRFIDVESDEYWVPNYSPREHQDGTEKRSSQSAPNDKKTTKLLTANELFQQLK